MTAKELNKMLFGAVADRSATDASRADQNRVHRYPFELWDSPGKGFGLFATKSIKRGGYLFEEKALVTNPTGGTVGILAQVEKLDEVSFQTYMSLNIPTRPFDPQIERSTRSRLVAAGFTGAKLELQVNLGVQARLIYVNNCFVTGASGQRATGVFPVTSRINHSCVPNVDKVYVGESDTLRAYAIRDIKKDEELLLSYVDIKLPPEVRAAHLQRWGIVCDCTACQGPATDPKELQRLVLQAEATNSWAGVDISSGPERAEAKKMLAMLKATTMAGHKPSAVVQAELQNGEAQKGEQKGEKKSEKMEQERLRRQRHADLKDARLTATKAQYSAKNAAKKHTRTIRAAMKAANYFAADDATKQQVDGASHEVELLLSKLNYDELANMAGKLTFETDAGEVKKVFREAVTKLTNAGLVKDGKFSILG